MSNLFWLTDAQMAGLRPFFPRAFSTRNRKIVNPMPHHTHQKPGSGEFHGVIYNNKAPEAYASSSLSQ